MTSTAASYLKLPSDSSAYQLVPLLSVGNEVPLLEGRFPDFSASDSQSFAFTGLPNGIGITAIDDRYYVYISHELSDRSFSNLNAASPELIQGARVSLYVFDRNWQAIGGKNLINQLTDSTGTYPLNTTTGLYSNTQTSASLTLDRFGSSYLATTGFVDSENDPVPLYFAPEQSDTGRGWAITPDGNALALDELGRFSKDTIYAASQFRATNADRTVLLMTEDSSDGELYLWVGRQTDADPNGLRTGDLYVLNITGAESESELVEGRRQTATWTKIDRSVLFGTDGQPLSTGFQLSQFVNTAGNSTNFQRLGGIAEDPQNPGTFYVASTGSNNRSDGGIARTATEAENPYGRLYRFSLNANNPTGNITNFEPVLTGGSGTGVSYNSLTVDAAGKVILQEDPTTTLAQDLLRNENRNASVWSFDIATERVDRLFDVNEDAAGTAFNLPDQPEWESSGIAILPFFDATATSGIYPYLLNVQAHSVSSTRYVEGGQLVLALPVRGGAEDDTLLGSATADRLRGRGGDDRLFGAGGDDTLIGGLGDDRLVGDENDDRLLGGGGDDRLQGNGGNDTLIGGSGVDRIRGGGGDDRIEGRLGNDRIRTGGGSDLVVIRRGQGADWVQDFNRQVDRIGLSNLPFADLSLEQVGNQTQISAGEQVLLTLRNVDATTLSRSVFIRV